MKQNRRYYRLAVSQVGDFIKEANDLVAKASEAMLESRPTDATSYLQQAKNALQAAITSARWAERLTDGDE